LLHGAMIRRAAFLLACVRAGTIFRSTDVAQSAPAKVTYKNRFGEEQAESRKIKLSVALAPLYKQEKKLKRLYKQEKKLKQEKELADLHTKPSKHTRHCKAKDLGLTKLGTPGVYYEHPVYGVRHEFELKMVAKCETIDYLYVDDCKTCLQEDWKALRLRQITGSSHEGRSICLTKTPGIIDMMGLQHVKGQIKGAVFVSHMEWFQTLTGMEWISSIGKDEFDFSIYLLGNTRLDSTLALLRAGYTGRLKVHKCPSLKCVPDSWPVLDFSDNKVRHGDCNVKTRRPTALPSHAPTLGPTATCHMAGVGEVISRHPKVYGIKTERDLQKLIPCKMLDYLNVYDCPSCTQETWSKLSFEHIYSKDPKHGRSITIAKAPMLLDMTGLSNVAGALTGGFKVAEMLGMISLHGLERIASFGKDYYGWSVIVTFNPALRNGFDLKAGFNGTLWVESNPRLKCVAMTWPEVDVYGNILPVKDASMCITAIPTQLPTHMPTPLLTIATTPIPTSVPTDAPTGRPTSLPTGNPTQCPTASPTASPTHDPCNHRCRKAGGKHSKHNEEYRKSICAKLCLHLGTVKKHFADENSGYFNDIVKLQLQKKKLRSEIKEGDSSRVIAKTQQKMAKLVAEKREEESHLPA
jgi:hypothetical protein